MLMKKAFIEKDQLREIITKRETTQFKSSFGFLQAHNGIRLGHIHNIIASTGASKSTLTRSIVLELAEQTKVLLIINEETAEQYTTDMNVQLRRKIVKETLSVRSEEEIQRILNNIIIIHEIDDNIPTNPGGGGDNNFISFLKRKIATTGAQIVVYDNITSGFITRNPVNIQNEISSAMIKLCRETDIALIVVLHTKKDHPPNKMTRSEDVKGLSIFPTNASYVYTITMFSSNDKKRPILWVTKSREHAYADGKRFELFYDPVSRMYESDKPVTEDELVDIYSWANPIRRTKNENKRT